MAIPKLIISEEAREHVEAAVATWSGDNRDLALALVAMGNAVLMILDGRTDHISLYDAAAKVIVNASTGPKLNG